MNKFKFTFLLVSAILILSCNEKTKSNKSANQQKQNQIEVLDFYGKHRCVTCIAIEENTLYTLETYFSEALANKTIVFKTINVDDKENEAIAEQFEAVGTALFLNVINDGTETAIDLTELAFMDGTEQVIFSKKLKTKIEEALKEI